jgi:hypothetical protein
MSIRHKPGRGTNKKGRSKTRGKFVALGDGLVTSEAWRALGGPAVKYYIELRRRFTGVNNGHLYLGLDEAKKLLHMGKTTALRAQQELVEKGLIRKTRAGGFHQRTAARWALTDEPVGTQPPSHDFKKWTPKKQFDVPPQDRTRSVSGPKEGKNQPLRSVSGPCNGDSEHCYGPQTAQSIDVPSRVRKQHLSAESSNTPTLNPDLDIPPAFDRRKYSN